MSDDTSTKPPQDASTPVSYDPLTPEQRAVVEANKKRIGALVRFPSIKSSDAPKLDPMDDVKRQQLAERLKLAREAKAQKAAVRTATLVANTVDAAKERQKTLSPKTKAYHRRKDAHKHYVRVERSDGSMVLVPLPDRQPAPSRTTAPSNPQKRAASPSKKRSRKSPSTALPAYLQRLEEHTDPLILAALAVNDLPAFKRELDEAERQRRSDAGKRAYKTRRERQQTLQFFADIVEAAIASSESPPDRDTVLSIANTLIHAAANPSDFTLEEITQVLELAELLPPSFALTIAHPLKEYLDTLANAAQLAVELPSLAQDSEALADLTVLSQEAQQDDANLWGEYQEGQRYKAWLPTQHNSTPERSIYVPSDAPMLRRAASRASWLSQLLSFNVRDTPTDRQAYIIGEEAKARYLGTTHAFRAPTQPAAFDDFFAFDRAVKFSKGDAPAPQHIQFLTEQLQARVDTLIQKDPTAATLLLNLQQAVEAHAAPITYPQFPPTEALTDRTPPKHWRVKIQPTLTRDPDLANPTPLTKMLHWSLPLAFSPEDFADSLHLDPSRIYQAIHHAYINPLDPLSWLTYWLSAQDHPYYLAIHRYGRRFALSPSKFYASSNKRAPGEGESPDSQATPKHVWNSLHHISSNIHKAYDPPQSPARKAHAALSAAIRELTKTLTLHSLDKP